MLCSLLTTTFKQLSMKAFIIEAACRKEVCTSSSCERLCSAMEASLSLPARLRLAAERSSVSQTSLGPSLCEAALASPATQPFWTSQYCLGNDAEAVSVFTCPF